MKKNKFALISMIVFMTVFGLTLIFDIQIPYSSIKGNEPGATETAKVETNALTPAAKDALIRSFSHDFAVTAYDVTSAQVMDDDLTITVTPIPAATLTPTPEDSATPEPTKEPEKAKYADIGISIADDFVNIREKPDTDAEIEGKLYKDSACRILDSKDGWYHVKSGSVEGYVNSDYIKTGISDEKLIDKYGTLSISVECDGLNVREEKSMDAKKLTVIYTDEVYPVIKNEDEWVKIKIPDEDITGYVKSEYTKLIVKFKEAVSKEEEELLKQIEAEKKAKQETLIKKRESTNYDYDDLQLLSSLIHAEAGSQNYETKLAVANVVLNRMKSSGTSMKSVIYAPGQFTVAASGSLQKQLDRYDNYSSSAELLTIKAAKDALAGSNNIGSRKHFNSYGTAVRKGYDDFDTAVKLGGLLFWK